MKKQLLCGILTLLLINAHAQSIAPSTADSSAKGMLAIKLTPFTLLRNMWFTAHVDYAFHPQFSASLGLSPNFLAKGNAYERDSIWHYQGTDTSYFDYVKTEGNPGFSIDPEIRWYPKGVWNGWFFGLYSSQRFSSAKIEEREYLQQIAWPGVVQYIPTNTGNYQILRTHVSVTGFQMGYVQRWGKRKEWLIDIFAGLGIKSTTFQYENVGSLYPDVASSQPGIGGRFNFSIGYLLR
jgi:hypothetical protein